MINLFKGSDSTHYQDMRQRLQVFLKKSKKNRKEMSSKEPELYAHFAEVWQVRENHYHKELPSQYIFLLTCCYKKGCPHPLCKEGCLPQEVRWFPGGPTVNQNLLPVPDPSRPLGDSNCKSCPKTCSGHFLPPEQALESNETPMVYPPSAVLKCFFHH